MKIEQTGCEKTMLLMLLSMLICAPVIGQDAPTYQFLSPIRLANHEGPLRTESPGYASPTMHDMDGDGIKDLLVGQYNDGKIQVFPGGGKGAFGKGYWLQAEGEDAQVPGVW